MEPVFLQICDSWNKAPREIYTRILDERKPRILDDKLDLLF